MSAFVRAICAIGVLAAFCNVASAETIPLPPPRPAPAASAHASPAPEEAAPSPCFEQLVPKLAVAIPVPRVEGAGACGADGAVRLEAIMLADKTRVAVTPPAIMRCSLAEAIARWVREDVAAAVRPLGSKLASVDNYASYDCRGRNRIVGAMLSEHGKANALDMRSFKLANGKLVELTSTQLAKDLRERLKKAACERFTTVLGPGSDGYHEDHVHVDLAERRGGYRMCQWDIREHSDQPAPVADTSHVPLPRPRPFARIGR